MYIVIVLIYYKVVVYLFYSYLEILINPVQYIVMDISF